MYIYTYTYIYICVLTGLHLHTYDYVYIHIYIYIYICTNRIGLFLDKHEYRLVRRIFHTHVPLESRLSTHIHVYARGESHYSVSKETY